MNMAHKVLHVSKSPSDAQLQIFIIVHAHVEHPTAEGPFQPAEHVSCEKEKKR